MPENLIYIIPIGEKNLFFPYAGLIEGRGRDFVDELGLYWSSTPYNNNRSVAYLLKFSKFDYLPTVGVDYADVEFRYSCRCVWIE